MEKLQIITLDSGKKFLGRLSDDSIVDAFDITDCVPPNRRTFEDYLKLRNLGDLETVTFSTVTGYTVAELKADQQAEWEFVAGLFAMAQKRAQAYSENRTFEALYVKK